MPTPYDQLLAMINTENPNTLTFNLNNISFSLPEINNDVNGNTKIVVTANPISGYVGNVTLFYDRINFQQLDSTVWLFSDLQFTNDAVVSLLNIDRNCIFLLNSDITPLPIPTMQTGDIVNLPLIAESNSINWIGETNLSLFMGFPAIEDTLHTLVNTNFPATGYLT